MSTNDDLTMLTGDELITLSVLIAYEVAAAVVPVAFWLFVLERMMTFIVLFHAADPEVFDFFTTHSFNMTVFSSKLLLRNPQLFYYLPAVFVTFASKSIPLPTPQRLQQPLPSRIKIAAALFFTPFFVLAHFQLFFHFQRIVQSTHKQLEDSTDLPVILGLLCVLFYGHFKVIYFWKDFLDAQRIRCSCTLHSITSGLMGHLFLWLPVLLTAVLMQSVDARGRKLYGVVSLVGVVTGVGVSLKHSESRYWRGRLDPVFLFSYMGLLFSSGFILQMTQMVIEEVTEGTVWGPATLYSFKVLFSVLMAAQGMYTAKALVFLLQQPRPLVHDLHLHAEYRS